MKFRIWLNKNIFVLLLFLLISSHFFYQIAHHQVAVPGDLLVGAYYPWLDYKWGYLVGVPVKNPSLSDVVSAQYPWRLLGMNIISSGNWPLWNPYSFSGTPLLANWQSAPIYPLNFLMLIFRNGFGWSLLVCSQIPISLYLMYLYLKELNLKTSSSIFGAISFAFAGFMTTYLQYATIGQAFMWLPLILLLIEKAVKSNKLWWLILIPFVNLFILTAGSFQAVFYESIIWGTYLIFRLFPKMKMKKIISSPRKILVIAAVTLLSFSIGAIQLLPTMELFSNSIRQADRNIYEYGFGLLPVKNILTLFAPDFLGNSATYNFWGTMGYQESAGYFGVIALIFLLAALVITIKSREKILVFWLIFLLVSFIFIIDSPLSRLVYQLKIPVLSTSYASRLFLIFDFAAAILAAVAFDRWQKNWRLVVRVTLVVIAILLGIGIGLGINIYMFKGVTLPEVHFLAVNLNVAFKNMIFPIGLVGMFLIILLLSRRIPKLMLLGLVVVALDMLRFGTKFNTFSPDKLLFPQTPVIDYLQQNTGFYRIDREKSQVMPPNSWIAYNLMTPSGYDPLYSASYGHYFNLYNNYNPEGGPSRYAELGNYRSPFINLAGIKYLLVLKRDTSGVVSSTADNISDKIRGDLRYKEVFEDKSAIVLENNKVMPRVSLFDKFDVEPSYLQALSRLFKGYDFYHNVLINTAVPGKLKVISTDQANIVSYTSNEVNILTETANQSILMLNDTFYPGWKATIDGYQTPVLLADGIYRGVLLPAGKHEVRFFYQPDSFKWGLRVTLMSFLLLNLVLIIAYKKKILLEKAKR